MTDRTPAERERMYALLWKAFFPDHSSWPIGAGFSLRSYVERFDRLLAAFPQLWDSLPPDPAERALRWAYARGVLQTESGQEMDEWCPRALAALYPAPATDAQGDRCSGCGQLFSDPACGPGHAMIAAERTRPTGAEGGADG